MRIYACPKCGNRNIRRPQLQIGALTGDSFTCANCSYQGMPVIFETEEEYKKFVKELSKIKDDEYENIDTDKDKIDINNISDKWSNKSKKQKIVDRPVGVTILAIFDFIGAIISLVVLFGFSEYYFGTLYPINDFQYAIALITGALSFTQIFIGYGLLKGYSWAWTGEFIIRVISGATNFPAGFIVSIIIIYYLTRPHVKAFFGKN